jgi:hypothetical protein
VICGSETDPVRAELPHTVLTLDVNVQTAPAVPLHVHPAIHATWLPTVSRQSSGSVSGPVAIAQRSPWSVPGSKSYGWLKRIEKSVFVVTTVKQYLFIDLSKVL